MSFVLFSFFALVLAVILRTVATSWTAVAQEFCIGFTVFLAFYLLEALVTFTMKRERSSSTSGEDLTRLTSLRRVAPASSSESLTPAAEHSMAEDWSAEVRERCRSLTLADLIAEIDRRLEEGAGTTRTVMEAPTNTTQPRNEAPQQGQRGRSRGRQGASSSRQGRGNPPPPPPPPGRRPPRPASPRDVPPVPALSRRNPGPRYIVAGELGELALPHRFLVDPQLPGHVVGRRTAELLGLRIRPVHGPPPPGFGFTAEVVREDGGTSEVIGHASARVKIGYEFHILDFMVVADRVETKLGPEVMRPFRLRGDRVNRVLYQSETSRIGIPDPRTERNVAP